MCAEKRHQNLVNSEVKDQGHWGTKRNWTFLGGVHCIHSLCVDSRMHAQITTVCMHEIWHESSVGWAVWACEVVRLRVSQSSRVYTEFTHSPRGHGVHLGVRGNWVTSRRPNNLSGSNRLPYTTHERQRTVHWRTREVREHQRLFIFTLQREEISIKFVVMNI